MAERLLANCVVSETRSWNGSRCWEWTGRSKPNAAGHRYGVVNTRFKRGPRKGKVRSNYAHRLAVVHLKRKRLRPRQVVLHLCNYTLCINPDHIKGGTQSQNVKQSYREGRRGNT